MEEAAELLKTWELPDLVPVFTEQQITIQALSALTKDDIKDLIPKAGPRALFLRCWRSWKQEFSSSSIDISNLDFTLLEPENVENFALGNAVSREPDVKLPEADNNLPQTDAPQESSLIICESSQCQILENLLKTSLDSASLLVFKGSPLKGDSTRNLLASTIAKEILNQHKGSMITGPTYYKWANYIKQLFPGERTTTYYIPACTTASGIVLQARGKLVHQVLNKRRRLQILGALPKGKRSREESPASSSSVGSPRPLPDDFSDNENENVEYLHWLRNSSEPWCMVEEKWKNTVKIRTRSLHNRDFTIEDYFNKYPALKKPHGYLLLHSDFDAGHQAEKNNLFIEFPVVRSKLLELLLIKNKQSELSNLVHSTNEETANLVGFLAIPELLNTSYVRLRKKTKSFEGNAVESWKPSKLEAREGFIKHVKSDAEVLSHVELRLAALLKKGAPSQPYIIIVGESLENIKTYLVVANRSIMYERFSIMEAVDTCYKIVWALNVEYSLDSYPVWFFIQRGLYKMCSKYDKGSTAAESLLTDCNA